MLRHNFEIDVDWALVTYTAVWNLRFHKTAHRQFHVRYETS